MLQEVHPDDLNDDQVSDMYRSQDEGDPGQSSTLKVVWPVLKSILEILIDVIL